MNSKTEIGEGNFPEGSAEDLALTLKNLNEFFAQKLKSIDLYNRTNQTTASTANTQSVCHTDGTTDCN